jgi:molecular chaperone DnaK
LVSLGIDFGTAYTRAVASPGGEGEGVGPAEVLDISAWREGIVPSMVLVPPEGIVVGDAAVTGACQRPTCAIHGLKRLLGRLPQDSIAKAVASRAGVSLSLSGAQLTLRTAEGVAITAENAVSAVLRHATNQVLGATAKPPAAVITVPEWYGPSQESALISAARRAGLAVLRLIDEAAAIALALAFQESGDRTVGLVNVGAGSFGVAFINIAAKSIFLLASASDRRVGGDDVTARLLKEKIGGLAGVEGPAQEPFRQAIEEMTQQLALGDEVRRRLPLGKDRTIDLAIAGGELDDALDVLRGPAAEVYADALDDAALEPEEVDTVFATGGMSTLPLLADFIFDLSGKVPHCGPELQGLAGRGAALQAAILSGQIDGPLVFDGKSTGSLHVSDFEGGG